VPAGPDTPLGDCCTIPDVQDHIDIRSMTDRQTVSGVYSLVNPQVGMTRNNKPFFKCLIRDATGEVPARQWSFEESRFPEIAQAGFVWISGRCELYQNSIQLILDDIRPQAVAAEDMAHLLPSSSRDIDEMMQELRTLMASLEHPAAQSLVAVYLEDEELMHRFRVAPAAVQLHHAWIGGLLEHTLQLIQLAERMLPLYPGLNRDIVLLGLFLHDLGKTAELEWEQGFGYTTDGNLIGHIARGAIWLQIKAAVASKRTGERLPPDFVRVLQHIILSHHGLPEHGAARTPSTPEAIFIAHLDNLDARTSMSLLAVDRAGGDERMGAFTERIWALDTKLYRPDPLADE